MLRSRDDEAGYCRYIELIADVEVFTFARKPGITPAFLRFWILYLHDLFLAPATAETDIYRDRRDVPILAKLDLLLTKQVPPLPLIDALH